MRLDTVMREYYLWSRKHFINSPFSCCLWSSSKTTSQPAWKGVMCVIDKYSYGMWYFKVVVGNFVACLLFLLFLLTSFSSCWTHYPLPGSLACKIIGYLGYTSTMAMFTWMLCLSLDLVTTISSTRYLMKFLLICFRWLHLFAHVEFIHFCQW